MTYLAKGLKTPWLGAVYGFFCLLASLGMAGWSSLMEQCKRLSLPLGFRLLWEHWLWED